MNKEEEKKKEEEIDRCYQIFLDAMPKDAFMENIAIALSRLAAETIWYMSDNEDDDNNDDESEEEIGSELVH